jgi:hypothetical protein
MGETKCALYLGAIFSTLFRLFSYIFLRVVCLNFFFLFLDSLILTLHASRPLSGWVNIYFLASISLAPCLSKPSRSPPSPSDNKEDDADTPTTQNEAGPCSRPVPLLVLTTSIGQCQQRRFLGAIVLPSYHSSHVDHHMVHQHTLDSVRRRLCPHAHNRFCRRRHLYSCRRSLPRRS